MPLLTKITTRLLRRPRPQVSPAVMDVALAALTREQAHAARVLREAARVQVAEHRAAVDRILNQHRAARS